MDIVSYLMGNKNGYEKGYEEGGENVVIEGSLYATDDGNGNITLTEVNNG